MESCIFCKIASGVFNTSFIYHDDQVVAFSDINPQAPVHVLIIPKAHIPSIRDLTDEALPGRLFKAAREIVKKLDLQDFRLVMNTGEKAGQSVFHLHIHLLGGRPMSWPPG